VLEANLEISTPLPCRIAVYEEDGVTKLATIKHSAMLELHTLPRMIQRTGMGVCRAPEGLPSL